MHFSPIQLKLNARIITLISVYSDILYCIWGKGLFGVWIGFDKYLDWFRLLLFSFCSLFVSFSKADHDVGSYWTDVWSNRSIVRFFFMRMIHVDDRELLFSLNHFTLLSTRKNQKRSIPTKLQATYRQKWNLFFALFNFLSDIAVAACCDKKKPSVHIKTVTTV